MSEVRTSSWRMILPSSPYKHISLPQVVGFTLISIPTSSTTKHITLLSRITKDGNHRQYPIPARGPPTSWRRVASCAPSRLHNDPHTYCLLEDYLDKALKGFKVPQSGANVTVGIAVQKKDSEEQWLMSHLTHDTAGV